MNNYKELKIWQKSIDMVEEVYDITKTFHKEEKYGLKNIFNLLDEIQNVNFTIINKFSNI